jgi:hypothetical protein
MYINNPRFRSLITFFWMRKFWHTEVKSLAQDHMAGRWQGWDASF